VPVALVGATIPQNQHDPEGRPFKLTPVKIRGVESRGMICSEYELGLGDDADGILVLDSSAKVGMPLARYFGQTDVLYELEITANRGDWLSYFGVAREVAALTKRKMRKPTVRLRESATRTASVAKVKILDRARCPRYSARVLRGVRVGPSPEWMQSRLRSVGLRPINNIVDTTNYVMLETGQPLHAFDFDTLAGRTIIVKTAAEGETFTTLDGKERTLTSDVLMICDAERSVAVAGVMGGINSEISDTTTNVLLESACFNPSAARRAARLLGLSTDASQRFERGTDIDMTIYALDRVAELLQNSAGAEVLKGCIDVYPKKRKLLKLKLRTSRVNEILGTSLTQAQVKSYLNRLELPCTSLGKDALRVVIPTFRNDLHAEIDLIEEVARMHGYDNIETALRGEVQFSTESTTVSIDDELRPLCIGAGFHEILTNSLVDGQTAALAGGNAITILNPVSVDMAFLRTTLIPGALQVVRRNYSYGQKDLRLFEIGNVFCAEEDGTIRSFDSVHQEERLLLLMTGNLMPPRYAVEQRKVDFFDLKGVVASVLSKFSLDKGCFISYDRHSPLSERNLAIEINGTYAGLLGSIKKSVLQHFEIEEDVFVCELSTSVLEKHWKRERTFKPLPRFPVVVRDLAFRVDATVPQVAVEQAVWKSGGPMLTKVTLFDVFTGAQVGEGKKSLAYTIEFQPTERTLTVHDVDTLVAQIVEHVKRACGATLRSS
jgi:phenylalanyl-tRNA synthetase beta chain